MSSFYLLPFTVTSQHQYYGEREVRRTNWSFDIVLISVLFLAVIAIHCEHSVLLDIVSIQLSYFTRMGLLVKCGLAALRRHLALPPYESSIRVLKVREFVNSFFPSIFSTDRLFYSTNHRRGPSIMRSRDLFWPISDLSVAVTSFYYSRLEAIGR